MLVATLKPKLAQKTKFLIISLHPAAAVREEDHSLAAAPCSRTPTKRYRLHRQCPRTRGDFRPVSPAAWPMTQAAKWPAPAAAPAPLESPGAVWRSPSRTEHRTTASSFRSPRKSTYAARPEFAALSAKS